VDPAKDDYRLQPESPAFKLGFKPLPIDQMGLVQSPERASWPVVEPEVYRDPPPPPPPPPLPPCVPFGRAYLRTSAMTTDGAVTAAEWGEFSSPRALAIERLSDGRTGSPGHWALVQFDADALYVAVQVNAPAGAQAAVELVLQPRWLSPNRAAPVLTLRGRAAGTWEWGDAPQTVRAGAAPRYAARQSPRGWSCEWRLPLAAWGMDAGQVRGYRFNVRVHERGGEPAAAWVTAPDMDGQEPVAGHLLIAPQIPASAANLMANGDFESRDDKGLPTGWHKTERFFGKWPPGSARPRCLWAAEGRGGSGCLKLEGLDANAMAVYEHWWAQTISVPAAGPCVMGYEIRTDAVASQAPRGRFYACGWARMKPGVEPKGMNLGMSPENRIERGCAARWTRRECRFVVPDDVEMLYLIFGVKQATGTVWIDNVRLERP